MSLSIQNRANSQHNVYKFVCEQTSVIFLNTIILICMFECTTMVTPSHSRILANFCAEIEYALNLICGVHV